MIRVIAFLAFLLVAGTAMAQLNTVGGKLGLTGGSLAAVTSGSGGSCGVLNFTQACNSQYVQAVMPL